MKFRISICLVLLMIILSAIDGYTHGTASVRGEQDITRLELQIRSDKDSYLPGQVIELNFRISNNTNESLLLEPGANVKTGRLQVFISEGTSEFLQYRGPRWGLLDGFPVKSKEMSPQTSEETSATLLHNYVPATYHLDERSAKQRIKGLINTEYAFPRPGVYYVKARLFDNAYANHIESKPIKILIEEAQGSDLEIWNTIKNDGAYAFFLQTGHSTGQPTDPSTEEIAHVLETLIERYPSSKYIEGLRTSLAKRQSVEKSIRVDPEK